jgi:hypothetical protein
MIDHMTNLKNKLPVFMDRMLDRIQEDTNDLSKWVFNTHKYDTYYVAQRRADNAKHKKTNNKRSK